MKRGVIAVLFIFLLASFAVADFHDDNSFVGDSDTSADDTDPFAGIGDVEIQEDAGLTPDSPFYFLDTLFEGSSDDPEKALRNKEEKIAELLQMLEEGKIEEAKQALRRAQHHSEILEREVSPDIERRARESSKAVTNVLKKIENDELREQIADQVEQEHDIAAAAQISAQIKQLCQRLSKVDPKEYERVCKTDKDDAKWHRDLDEDLTQEQREEAEKFFAIMSECFENPRECRCSDITVSAFADKCSEIAPLAADCMDGDEAACDEMDRIEQEEDPFELLPDYLQDVLDHLEDEYDEDRYDHFMPDDCLEQGATTREACMKIMFAIHAPPECQEALERGEIDPENEREAREQCERIMFESEAPQECIDAGARDHRECEKIMFKLDAPQECLDKGLDGTKRDDWRKCEAIRFKSEVAQECLDAGLTGEGRDDWQECNKIQFLLDAPEECHHLADERDPWKACQPIEFKMYADEECLGAGLDGTGRDDWDECNRITFKRDMPEYCHHLTDKRDPWRECEKLRFEKEAPEECHKFANERDPWRACDAIRHEFEEEYHGEYDDYQEKYDDARCPPGEYEECNGDECWCVNTNAYEHGDDYEESYEDYQDYEDHGDYEDSDYEGHQDYEDYQEGNYDEQDNEDNSNNEQDSSGESDSNEEPQEEQPQEQQDEPQEENEPAPEEPSDEGGNELTGAIVLDATGPSFWEKLSSFFER